MKNISDILFLLIRREICHSGEGISAAENLAEDELKKLYSLSRKHDISNIVGSALQELDLLPDLPVSEFFKNSVLGAIWRYEKQNYELENICAALEKAQIPHIPLKGSVLRHYYPKAWYRTSGDIDILVHEEDLDSALEAITAGGTYTVGQKASHDIALTSAANVHIELHYDLVEDGLVADSTRLLREVWENSSREKGFDYRMAMSREFFFFYHIAHMAKHFKNGGCGIRPLLDLWILEHSQEYDGEKIRQFLTEAKIDVFAESAHRLSEYWFSGAVADETTEKMQNYIISGGVYGTMGNMVSVKKSGNSDSKLKYIWIRVFERYDVLKFRYPILKKHRWLLPIMQVRRWFSLLKKDSAKRTLREMKTLNEVNTDGVNDFLSQIGL